MATYNKKNIEDISVAGKTVLVRCDFNVPMKDGVITSDKRIVGALPTVKYLLDNGAKVILCSHMGKPHSIFTEGFGLTKKERRRLRHFPRASVQQLPRSISRRRLPLIRRSLLLSPYAKDSTSFLAQSL